MKEDVYPRALEVHALLKKGGQVNSRTIALQYDISQRHGWRVIEYLRDRLRAPLIYDQRTRTYRYSEPNFELPAVILTEGEAVGMILAHEALLRQHGSPLGRRLRRALDTLRSLFPQSISVGPEQLLSHVTFSALPARPVTDHVLETVTTALERRQRLAIEYYSPEGNEVTRRDIDVYHLAHVRGDWYAVAYCHLRGSLRKFGLSRMKALWVVESSYTIPEDFSIQDYLKRSMGVYGGSEAQRIVLEFEADSARWARERTWHPSQELEELPEGRVRLCLQVGLSMEVVRWVLSWGGHVQVVEPAELKAQVAREVRTMAARYGAAASMDTD